MESAGVCKRERALQEGWLGLAVVTALTQLLSEGTKHLAYLKYPIIMINI